MKKLGFDNFNLFKKISGDNTTIVKLVWIIIGTVCGLFLLTFLISAGVTKSRTERDFETREAETILNNTAASIEANIENYKDLSRLVMLNDDVIKFLRALSVDAGMINDVRFGVLDIMNVSDYLDSVIVIRNDYSYMNTGRSTYTFDTNLMRTDKWRNILLDKRGGAIISINGSGAVIRQDGAPIITIGRAVYDINSQKQKGYLLLNFSSVSLEKIVNARGKSKLCIIADDGTYLAGNKDLCKFGEGVAEDGSITSKVRRKGLSSEMISTQRVKDTPFIIICLSSSSSASVPKEIIISFLLLMLAFIVCTFVTASFMMSNFTRPILQLSKAMETTRESGWLEKVDIERPNNEIGILADNYNSMIESLNTLFKELIEKEKAVQKAEMSVLYEQIKPHFLYNSLECINAMAYEVGASDVQTAIEKLGSFYRNTLSKGSGEIPLKREIAIIKDYIYLQRLRYGDILNDEYDLDESIMGIYVPKLILQPLVENSIYHGIRLKGEPGVIKITTKSRPDSIYISVYDTGVGMHEDKIIEIMEGESKLKKDRAESEILSGFGLKGTVERIRYYTGSNDSVRITSSIGEYTNIEIIIPINRKEEADNVQSNDN